jgi:hypothetical protein
VEVKTGMKGPFLIGPSPETTSGIAARGLGDSAKEGQWRGYRYARRLRALIA